MITVAMQRIHIGDASAIYFLMVVWVPVMESLWRRRCVDEHVGAGAFFAFVGVVFVIRPNFVFGEMTKEPLTTGDSRQVRTRRNEEERLRGMRRKRS